MNRDYCDPCDDSRSCEIDGEPCFVPESDLKFKFDPVTKKFSDILRDSGKRFENEYNYVPESTTIAVVASFPDKKAEVVRLYTADYENVRLALMVLDKLSRSSVHLKTPYGGF